MGSEQVAWVVPGKIDTNMIENLPDRAMTILADLSSNIVVMHVNRFLSGNQNSNVANIVSVSDKLRTAYAYTNEKMDYLKSDKVKEMAAELRNLQFEDITYTTPRDKLENYKMLIEELMDNEYASAYTDEKDSQYLKAGIKQLEDVAGSLVRTNASPNQVRACYQLVETIKDNKSLFRNPPFKKNSATILRSVLYRKEDFELILSGLEFILKKLDERANPRSWRFC